MWFDAWPDLLRVVLVGSAAYVTLVVVLRATGKRTLAKLNAFDLVVTVALGSTLATILLSAEVSWAEGAVALLLLALLQYAAALVATRPRGGRRLLSAADIRQAVRSDGHGDLTRIAAGILETDGSLSVITGAAFGDGSALDGVEEPE
ncbi:DUF421 domain-containing protein [Nocardia otitidiscaviarum]|uniref:DUF421 domain-containing protein n=1 Tax=Nocardia otitidiscaviarum TaxID=1823 RepID=A0A516NHH8_9NOCA|nr:DUF421 domain-containing protein [Nocardia otitidiscaviarum]MCP9620149.1 DUF421 domain-containing protein [Nocardia otitidiscaviarum]QDP78355.1 DUF421 domain-containing protein [Nocardia otitidiscaviarum]